MRKNHYQRFHNVLFCLLVITLLISCTQHERQLVAQAIQQVSDVPLLDADFSSDSSTIAILNVNQEVTIWDNNHQQLIKNWQLKSSKEPSFYISMSMNKQVIAVAGKHFVTLLSVKNDAVIATWQVEGNAEFAQITSVLLNNRGDKVFIGLSDGSIVSVDIRNQTRSIFQIHSTSVKHLILSEDQQSIISASFDGSVVQWSVNHGKIIWQTEQKFRITSMVFDPFNNRLFVSDTLDSQHIFSLNNNSTYSSLQYYQRNRYFRQALFVDNKRKLLTSSSKYQLSLWDVQTGQEIASGNIQALTLGSTVLSLGQNERGDVFSISSDGVVQTWPFEQFK